MSAWAAAGRALCAVVCGLALARGAAAAEPAPTFPPLAPTTPPLAAVHEWHQSLLAGDYERYRAATTSSAGSKTTEGTRPRFDELRSNAPPVLHVVLSLPLSGNSAQQIHLIGCSGADVRLAAVTVEPPAGGGAWKVVDSMAFVAPQTKSTYVCPEAPPGPAAASAPAAGASDANLIRIKVPRPGEPGDSMPGVVYMVFGFVPQTVKYGYLQAVDAEALTIASGSATLRIPLTPSTRVCLSGTLAKAPKALAAKIGAPITVLIGDPAGTATASRVDDAHLAMERDGFAPKGPRFPECR